MFINEHCPKQIATYCFPITPSRLFVCLGQNTAGVIHRHTPKTVKRVKKSHSETTERRLLAGLIRWQRTDMHSESLSLDHA